MSGSYMGARVAPYRSPLNAAGVRPSSASPTKVAGAEAVPSRWTCRRRPPARSIRPRGLQTRTGDDLLITDATRTLLRNNSAKWKARKTVRLKSKQQTVQMDACMNCSHRTRRRPAAESHRPFDSPSTWIWNPAPAGSCGYSMVIVTRSCAGGLSGAWSLPISWTANVCLPGATPVHAWVVSEMER